MAFLTGNGSTDMNEKIIQIKEEKVYSRKI